MKGRVGLIRIGVALYCLAALFLGGCATSAGFGRDVQSLGHGIENTAK